MFTFQRSLSTPYHNDWQPGVYVDGNAVLVDDEDSGDYGVTRQWTVDKQDKVQNYQDKVRNNEDNDEERLFHFKTSHNQFPINYMCTCTLLHLLYTTIYQTSFSNLHNIRTRCHLVLICYLLISYDRS